MKKIINHTNENLCSIFHARFKRLRKIIPNVKQAQLLDYILLGWQTSNYKLKDSEHKWFMKEYKVIVEETGLSLSTLKRYVKELKEEGLIECKQALFSRSTEFGFEVKKANYIAITPKLLSLLQQDKTIRAKDVNKSEITKESITNEAKIIESEFSKCSNLNKNELTEELNLSRSYIRDLYLSLNNNINSQNFVKNVNNEESLRANTLLLTIEKTLYSDIKEEIPNEIKNLVFGTFVNLVKKHKVILSSPKQVVAEYIFALINYDFFLKNVDCIKHRNNILAKLLKTNTWKTPKGFYNHFYLGESFRDKTKIREQWWSKSKENEARVSSTFLDIIYDLQREKDSRLVEVENEMGLISDKIETLKEMLPSVYDENDRIEIRNEIEELTNKLHRLWDFQKNLENDIEKSNHQLKIKGKSELVA